MECGVTYFIIVLVFIYVTLLTFTFCLFIFRVVYSAHSHNLSLIAEVGSDISWIKPASAAPMSSCFVCSLLILRQCQAPHAETLPLAEEHECGINYDYKREKNNNHTISYLEIK